MYYKVVSLKDIYSVWIFDTDSPCLPFHCPYPMCFSISPLLVLKQEVPHMDRSIQVIIVMITNNHSTFPFFLLPNACPANSSLLRIQDGHVLGRCPLYPHAGVGMRPFSVDVLG